VAVAPAVAVREAALAAAGLAVVLDRAGLAEPGPVEWAGPECPALAEEADPAAVFRGDQECRGREETVLRSATSAVVQAVRART